MTTMLETYGMAAVRAFQDTKAPVLSSPDPTLLMGLELETERLINVPEDMYVAGMTGARDGSLRGNAWEFITKPANYSNQMHILGRFFAKNKDLKQENYSERCSIHVHCNVQDMTLNQVKTVCLLYQVVEGVFFAFAGEERVNNIFCVPWAETGMTQNVLHRMDQDSRYVFRTWQKYMGLNLLPITSQGTVEFRHLPGTSDLKRIGQWLRLIGCLFAWAKKTEYKDTMNMVTELNTTSLYKAFIYSLFAQEMETVDTIPDWEHLLQEGVLNVKYMAVASEKPAKSKTLEGVNIWQAIRERGIDDLAAPNAEQVFQAANPAMPNANWLNNLYAQVEAPREVLQARPQPAPIRRQRG